MAFGLLLVGVALPALFIWSAVRAVNGRERWTKWAALALAASGPLYVLEVGPISAVLARHSIPYWADAALSRFYWPLAWCCDKVPVFGSLMNWYVGLWIP